MNFEDTIEGAAQRAGLKIAEEELGVGPGEMATLMGVSYGVYKRWKSGARKMPAVAHRCLELVRKTEGKL